MSNILQISKYQKSLELFSYQEKLQQHFDDFLNSRLGKIWLAIPWNELIKSLGLKNPLKGPPPIFSAKGKLALMFLKSFTQNSDQQIIESLNANIHHQIFCDIYLGQKKLENYKIISKIRCELASKLNIDKIQKILFKHWSPYVKNKNIMLVDATCYESDLRYPTDQKLLWECIERNYKSMKYLCKLIKLKRPKTKYNDVKIAYSIYSKSRKKTNKKRKKITRRLLHLLNKLNLLLSDIENKVTKEQQISVSTKYIKERSTIIKIYNQQNHKFNTGEKIEARIVSISKDYIRPIVRGKESKRVEFGAKVNKFQIDGIDMIEKISFDNFNECCNFESSIEKSEDLTGEKLKIVGGDNIYGTNSNRTFARKKDIQTSFKRKGKAGKNEKQRKQLSKEINRERSTRLEGSFGNEKRHYNLRKIKARTEATEILWIFFGVHTKNCLEIGRRISRVSISEKCKNTG